MAEELQQERAVAEADAARLPVTLQVHRVNPAQRLRTPRVQGEPRDRNAFRGPMPGGDPSTSITNSGASLIQPPMLGGNVGSRRSVAGSPTCS